MSEIKDINKYKAKRYTYLGIGLICVGILLLCVKALSFEYIDSTGLLHENFFLIPISFVFLFSGLFVII